LTEKISIQKEENNQLREAKDLVSDKTIKLLQRVEEKEA
jgi:hypothetical protein